MSDAPIANVGELCDRLIAELDAREKELLQGQPQATAGDPFQNVGDDTTLKQNLEKLTNAALAFGGTDADMVGCQEANAFLTGFANAHHRRFLPRTSQWQRAHERTLLAGKPAGVVKRQLAGIGEKVDATIRTQVSSRKKV
jgi:hypothetical protein